MHTAHLTGGLVGWWFTEFQYEAAAAVLVVVVVAVVVAAIEVAGGVERAWK